MTATETLDLVRDDNTTCATLARHFGKSENWAAGVIDCIDAEIIWADFAEGYEGEPTPYALEQYAAGVEFARGLVIDAATEEGWAECNALVDMAAELVGVACGPMDDSDIPF